MAEAKIPVDLFNPGQVFACLGFLEAADILCGDAEGGFDWSDPTNVTFRLRAQGAESPIATALEFLSSVTVRRVVPRGWVDEPKKRKNKDTKGAAEQEEDTGACDISGYFPAKKGDRMSLPIRVGGGNLPIV